MAHRRDTRACGTAHRHVAPTRNPWICSVRLLVPGKGFLLGMALRDLRVEGTKGGRLVEVAERVIRRPRTVGTQSPRGSRPGRTPPRWPDDHDALAATFPLPGRQHEEPGDTPRVVEHP